MPLSKLELKEASQKFKKCIEGNLQYQLLQKGETYLSMDNDLVIARAISSEIAAGYGDIKIRDFNYDTEAFRKAQHEYLSKYLLFQPIHEEVCMEAPFFVDFGCNIKLGKGFYSNFNVTFLDCVQIEFGDYVLVGPNTTFATAGHPNEPEKRLDGEEWAKKITIGDNVWIGSNCVILPGVNIGSNSVIGAGSVVTRDIEPNSVAVGSPAKVVKKV